jgi:hypothetical protein
VSLGVVIANALGMQIQKVSFLLALTAIANGILVDIGYY